MDENKSKYALHCNIECDVHDFMNTVALCSLVKKEPEEVERVHMPVVLTTNHNIFDISEEEALYLFSLVRKGFKVYEVVNMTREYFIKDFSKGFLRNIISGELKHPVVERLRSEGLIRVYTNGQPFYMERLRNSLLRAEYVSEVLVDKYTHEELAEIVKDLALALTKRYVEVPHP